MLCYFMLSYDVSLSLWNTSGFQIEKRVTLRRTVKETEYDWFYQVEAHEQKKRQVGFGKYHGTDGNKVKSSCKYPCVW